MNTNEEKFKFRPNYNGAIHILGEFTQDMANSILPKLIQLKEEGNPITILINSPGGDVEVFDILLGVLRTDEFDKKRPTIITVSPGNAHSAGAFLLALGDYSYAYEHSKIHLHGVRQYKANAVRAEDAELLMAGLVAENRRIARHIAYSMIHRFIDRFAKLKPDFLKKIPNDEDGGLFEPLFQYVNAVKRTLSYTAWHKVDEAYKVTKKLEKLIVKMADKTPGFDENDSYDYITLRKVLDFERAQNLDNKSWRIGEAEIQAITADYFLLKNVYLKESESLNRWVGLYGKVILSELHKKFIATKTGVEKDAAFESLAWGSLQPIWCFLLVLSRELLRDENTLSASDAYWLGIIDEVIGTSLLGARTIHEAKFTPHTTSPGLAPVSMPSAEPSPLSELPLN